MRAGASPAVNAGSSRTGALNGLPAGAFLTTNGGDPAAKRRSAVTRRRTRRETQRRAESGRPEAGRPAGGASSARRSLPAVGALLATEAGAAMVLRYGHDLAAEAARSVIKEMREATTPGGGGDRSPADEALDAMAAWIAERIRPSLTRVINATGVVIHTNLGRAPLAEAAREAVAAVASGSCDLELDLETGARSSREVHIEQLVCDLTGADAAIAVNNCAAAVLVTLAALASGGGVIASRGELVEIVGGFRIPDVILQSGARLIEVGTTNRTRAEDYERAIDESADARVLLRTHPSNYQIVGFTEAPALKDLAALARRKDLPLVEDLGGGALVGLGSGAVGEPTVQASIAAGADIVLFSGDKLLGGPQAGLIIGRRDLVRRIARHPLARAVRIDKLSLAALGATLRLYRTGRADEVPVVRMLRQPPEAIQARAARLMAAIADTAEAKIELAASVGFAGGGAMAMQPLATSVVRIRPRRGGVEHLAARLRTGEPAVLPRVEQGWLMLDARTLADDEVAAVATAVRAALGP
ncbi:L-seryl-tRNA(Sec) selenium transferase [bacterium]|nr:L-seryl-tRNA(Sec) selenium transferase [bacterium]